MDNTNIEGLMHADELAVRKSMLRHASEKESGLQGNYGRRTFQAMKVRRSNYQHEATTCQLRQKAGI